MSGPVVPSHSATPVWFVYPGSNLRAQSGWLEQDGTLMKYVGTRDAELRIVKNTKAKVKPFPEYIKRQMDKALAEDALRQTWV